MVTVPGLPAAPTLLTATAVSNPALAAGYEVALGWTNNAPGATSVEVERAVGAGAFSPLATLVAPVSSYTDATVVPGDYSYRIRVIDAIGPSAYSNVAPVTVPQPGSTTVVVGVPNPSFVGESVTFTATVSPVLASGTPTGTVVFTANGVVTPVPLDGAGKASLTTALLPAGTNTVTADYGGDAIFLPSAGSVDQVVNQGTTSVLLTSSNNPSVNGENVTFTATVSAVGGFGNPSGNVEFFDNGASLGVATLAGNSASFSTATLAVGTHPITAVYSGDVNFAGNTSPTGNQVVNPGTTSTSVVGAPNPSDFGSTVIFTATVTAINGDRNADWLGRVLRRWREPRLGAATRW